ncbi:MAG: trypsin-like peptidase domain-containing protein [Candidatus Dormibacteraeota bacterium]|nr:trypsin-like peptidase domain-containing protein [Candidatus Dormibacteraeota bacterium]
MIAGLRVLAAVLTTALPFALGACSFSPPTTGSPTVTSPTPSLEPGSSPTPRQQPSPNQTPGQAVAPGPNSQGSFDSVRAAQVLSPSVALIIVTTNAGTGEGSGFVIQSQGGTSFLVTNNHVVDGGTKVQVAMPDGRHFIAAVQGTDPLEDVAVIKVGDSLPVALFADSTRVQVGQPVVAIGSPLGSQGFGTVTVGVVSALHRTLSSVSGGDTRSSESLADVMQSDAPINPGNSGGPLGDGNGHVVGMNTANSSNAAGIGYAIPSRIVQRVAQNLIAGKSPGHPYLGVCFVTVEDALARDPSVKGYGVLVMGVAPDTPAQRAGLKNGDVIEKVDGVDLNNGQTFGGVIQLHNPGDPVRLTALRSGGTVQLNTLLGDRPANGGPTCNTP